MVKYKIEEIVKELKVALRDRELREALLKHFSNNPKAQAIILLLSGE